MPAPDLLTDELTLTGRITTASNATFLGSIGDAAVVHKPLAGEKPLWDFPDGCLAHREVAAYLVSEALGWAGLGWAGLGWNIVPRTWLGDGPLGDGMVQLWQKTMGDGHRHGVDHGLRFHSDHKLRTVLWGWIGEALSAEELAGIDRVLSGIEGEPGLQLARSCSLLRRLLHSARVAPGCVRWRGSRLPAAGCRRCLCRCSRGLQPAAS